MNSLAKDFLDIFCDSKDRGMKSPDGIFDAEIQGNNRMRRMKGVTAQGSFEKDLAHAAYTDQAIADICGSI